MVAHRLHTVRIVFLDRGRIVEQGTHDELVRRGGRYARFWERSVRGGFIDPRIVSEHGYSAEPRPPNRTSPRL